MPTRSKPGDDNFQSHSVRDSDMETRVAAVLARYREPVSAGLKEAIESARTHSALDASTRAVVDAFYGQMAYHFGWRDAELREANTNSGKLLRPTLLMLGCELASGTQGATTTQRAESVALPAAIAIEIVHNFSLVHDDIEDRDEERRHRPTLWRVWGQPQAINTGDGMFALARMTLLRLVDRGVSPALVVHLADLLDRTCLRLCEGQHLDMSFEGRHDVSAAMYLAMIERKTAALMACALEIGARLGGADNVLAQRLSDFGLALGMAFQLRDDMLGIWADFAHLGKVEAGDLRRKKMSLPVIYALERASRADREQLLGVYASAGPATDEQVDAALEVLERTGAQAHIQAVLRNQCAVASSLLASVARTASATGDAHDSLNALVEFIARTTA